MLDLKVTVVDASTQQPVSGAEVSVFRRDAVKVTTDAAGVAVLPVRINSPMPERDSRFSFSVKSPRHEPRQVEWFSDGGRVREMLPTEYTVALPPGATVGGVVRDENDAPVRGARITLYASGLKSRTLGRGDKLQQEYGAISVAEADALVTDNEGRWRLEHFPTEITQIGIEVLRPEGARTRFISGTMYRGPNERGGTVELDPLFRQDAVFKLKAGVTVRGLVVDEAGRPVGGVQLRMRDSASRNQPHTFINQPDGTFSLPHWDVSSVLVTAEKEGFQARSATIAAGGDAGVGRIVLTPAKPLVVRIVGEDDAPLAGAEIQSDINPSPEQIVNWKTRTDANGRAEWPTAPDKPVTLWVTPPAGSIYPFRSARLIADGNEHVIRVRRGSDKAIQVRIRAVDATTGAAVPAFEVWRRLANQPFKAWGDPAEKGAFSREMLATELPNGFVPSYRLQVRAAGYTGWASDTIDFSAGDQDLALKLTEGESTLANDPPPRRGGAAGFSGEFDLQLLGLGGAVARLLETGEVSTFVGAVNTSLDDWKRLLPPGASEKDLPLGPNPARILELREKSIAASATHVLELARRAGLSPGKARFSVKSVSSPTNSTSGYRIAGQTVTMPFATALRVTLTAESSEPSLRGDYELALGGARKFPNGWRTEDGVRWMAFPPQVADRALREEVALGNRVAPAAMGDQRTLSGMDDPALLRFGTVVADLLRQRDAAAFVRASRLTRDETFAFYKRTDRTVTPEVEETYSRISTGLAATAQAMSALQERIGIDLGDAKLTVKQVLAERPHFMRYGQADGISASSLQITFTVESSRNARSGKPLAGTYVVATGSALRLGDRWVLVDDKARFKEFPSGLVTDSEAKHIELENYVAEHRTLPPGHAAPDVSFVRLDDNTPTPLSAYRGKVVVLEFWAVWCGPCQEPMEKLQRLRESRPDWKDRVEVIALSIDEKADTARAHLEKKGWAQTTNVWAGEGAWQAPAPQAFRVHGVPTVYVLDREGRVVKAGHPESLNVAALVDEQLKKTSL